MNHRGHRGTKKITLHRSFYIVFLCVLGGSIFSRPSRSALLIYLHVARTTLFAALLIGLAPVSADIGTDSIAKTKALLSRLEALPSPAEFVVVANELGPIVDELRQAEVTPDQLREMRRLCGKMRTVTERKLSQTEAAAGENEAALERLYQSQVWDDLSFSLAAFPYWRAWIDLELARLNPDKAELAKDLLPARKGFRAASMQLFRPGLVFGGWLGLGYVELERGRYDRASAIFANLEQALDDEPDHPIRQAVNLELRLLAARQGTVKKTRRGAVVDDNEIVILKAEAFALLQQSRKTGGRALEAADRLKTIIAAGRIDQQLLSDMMHFRQELAGVNVGPYTDLAGAEFALEFEHWHDAMMKYQKFFSTVNPPPGLDLSNYRYRWALAAYRNKIYQPAIDILEKLIRRPNLVPELDKAASKLLYAVYATREQAASSAPNRKALRTAAQRFIRKNPDDAGADSARLLMAQTASNATTALKALGQVRSPSKLKGDVERTAFQVIANEFSRKISRGKDAYAIGPAKQGIQAWTRLPKADKKDQFNFAVLMEMRALVGEEPEKVLEQLRRIEEKGNLSLDVRRALVWSRLKLFDRLGDSSRALEYVRGLSAQGIPSWQLEYLYPWILNRKDNAERLALVRIVRPQVEDLPDMDRRFRVMLVEILLEQADTQAAYDGALDFAKQHPTSGDAWKLLAKASEASEQPFEADRAWGVITNKAVPTMPIWWEGMLSRVRIRADSTRPEQACPLLAELDQHSEYLPANFIDELTAALGNSHCETVEASL